MVNPNLTQDGIGHGLSEPFYLAFSQLMKLQFSDDTFALGAKLAGGGSRFVRGVGKGSPGDNWRNCSDAKHFTLPWRRKSSQ
jgi:hypothetical protein